MPINIQRPAGINVTVENPNSIVYIKGKDSAAESWRLKVESPPERLVIEHRETLLETDITLDQTKIGQIIAAGHSSSTPFFGSVLIDNRTNQAAPRGINGDMSGRVIEFDGFIWNNFPDEWVEKASFEESLFSDRGIFRRMNVIDTDPNDNTASPPTPVEGTTIGARNTISDGSGVEMLSLTNKDGFFGMIPVLLHGGSIDVIDNIISILVDDLTIVSSAYESLHRTSTNYIVGDVIVQKGQRFICNTDGLQVGDFIDNISFWDPDLALPNFDIILVGDDGDVVTGDGENIVTTG